MGGLSPPPSCPTLVNYILDTAQRLRSCHLIRGVGTSHPPLSLSLSLSLSISSSFISLILLVCQKFSCIFRSFFEKKIELPAFVDTLHGHIPRVLHYLRPQIANKESGARIKHIPIVMHFNPEIHRCLSDSFRSNFTNLRP